MSLSDKNQITSLAPEMGQGFFLCLNFIGGTILVGGQQVFGTTIGVGGGYFFTSGGWGIDLTYIALFARL